MAKADHLSRRGFLKIAGVSVAAASLPPDWEEVNQQNWLWPKLEITQLPPLVQKILLATPYLYIRPDGILITKGLLGQELPAPQQQTQWNIDNNRAGDRLLPGILKGIVLHWYGDNENFDRSIQGYLRGFNSLRKIGDQETRTSAHYLVGGSSPQWDSHQPEGKISIVQTQFPFRDGTPLVASHLSGLSMDAHQQKKQYFVRALYELGKDEPQPWTLLQEMYDGRRVDPNMRTFAVEITGRDFENPNNLPSVQKTANVVALVSAIMKRYKIRSLDLLGHNEVLLGKPDPGKKFMALIRLLIGVKALLERDQQLSDLTFSPYLDSRGYLSAVISYFSFVRSYLRLVSVPHQVFFWENIVGYWNLMELISGRPYQSGNLIFQWPVFDSTQLDRNAFLVPANHEGIDFTSSRMGSEASNAELVYLTASGQCLFLGRSMGCQAGQAAIFRHRLPTGAELLSVYSHLKEIGNFRKGEILTTRSYLGKMEDLPWNKGGFLHYALAFGASWETNLKHRVEIPRNAGPAWIRQRFIDPLEFHHRQSQDTILDLAKLPINF